MLHQLKHPIFNNISHIRFTSLPGILTVQEYKIKFETQIDISNKEY